MSGCDDKSLLRAGAHHTLHDWRLVVALGPQLPPAPLPYLISNGLSVPRVL